MGTVREIGRLGSSNSPEKTVVVNWDSGNRTNYRIGYQDKFDLIVIDNAQIGERPGDLPDCTTATDLSPFPPFCRC